jgi:hypothetical protein
MPTSIDSITFADEFNTGTTTDFISANVGDKITATIQISYSNIIDASVDSSYQIRALDTANITGYPTGGLQAFEIPNDVKAFYRDEFNEYNSFVGQINPAFQITASDFTGAIDGTYTFKEIYFSKYIICNEAHAGNNAGNSGVLAITEAITTCDLDFRLNGTNNNNLYAPPIEISNSTQAINFKTTGTDLDATNATPVNIPFTYQSENNTGSLTRNC